MTKTSVLGRGLNDMGLDKLLSQSSQPEVSTKGQVDQFRQLPIDQLQPGKYQPRKAMDYESLQELATSIRAQGIIQPIIVRHLPSGSYEIIAGERRWRAAQLANLTDVPVVIKNISEQAVIAMALIENIQREDLNVIEEAMTLERLINEFGLTHQAIAETIGRSRAAVSNLLRLLQLPPQIKLMIEHGDLEMGHARALLSLASEKQIGIAREIIENQLSVRETERLVKKVQAIEPAVENKSKSLVFPEVGQFETDLRDKLDTNVVVQHQSNGKGKILIHYRNKEHLTAIIKKME